MHRSVLFFLTGQQVIWQVYSLHLLTIYCGHSCHMRHGDSLGLSSCIQGKTWPAACNYKYIFWGWFPRGLRLFIWHRYINHIIFGNHVIVKISRQKLNQIHIIQAKYLWILKEVLETVNADTIYKEVSVRTAPFGQTKHWDEQTQFCVLLILEYKQYA